MGGVRSRIALAVLPGVLAGVLLGALAAACTRQPMPELALACQTTKCVCLPAEASFPVRDEPAEVLWRDNGDAYCPEAHVLRREGDTKR
jgi:hypothetical protein